MRLHSDTILAFDADDTLWHNEIYFRRAEREFAESMLPFCNLSEQEIISHLMEVEGRNIPQLGYGSKTFIIALTECAIELCGGKAPNSLILKAIEIGKRCAAPKLQLYPGVEEVLSTLEGRCRLVMATKGDLKDQRHKIERSGLSHYFSHIEIMEEKCCDRYLELLRKCGGTPDNFIMVGNSFKSDIKPVLEIGAKAIYIPSEIIWVHEIVEEFQHPDLVKLDTIKKLPSLLGL